MWLILLALSLIANYLPVASGTTLQHSSSLNPIFRLQFDSFLKLLRRFVLRPPCHVENLVSTTDKPFRLAMTLQTPLHLQRRCLIEDRHVVDPSVTRRTANAFLHVNAVIEIGEVRQVVNSYPLDRFPAAEARAHRFEIWTIRPDLFMTTHARRG